MAYKIDARCAKETLTAGTNGLREKSSCYLVMNPAAGPATPGHERSALPWADLMTHVAGADASKHLQKYLPDHHRLNNAHPGLKRPRDLTALGHLPLKD